MQHSNGHIILTKAIIDVDTCQCQTEPHWLPGLPENLRESQGGSLPGVAAPSRKKKVTRESKWTMIMLYNTSYQRHALIISSCYFLYNPPPCLFSFHLRISSLLHSPGSIMSTFTHLFSPSIQLKYFQNGFTTPLQQNKSTHKSSGLFALFIPEQRTESRQSNSM